MRSIFPLAVLLIAQVGAAWATSEPNMARPGATYTSIEATDAGACERACAEDTICMAWSYRESACELKATVPPAIIQTGSASGVSARAPNSLRFRSAPPDDAASPPALAEIETEGDGSTPMGADDDLSMALLGGPEPERELRHRLGN